MDKYGKLIDNQTLKFERLLPGPIERVWSYITDAELRSKWFCSGTDSQNPGGEMTFRFHNSQLGTPPEPTPEKYKEFGDGFESKAVIVKSDKPCLLIIEWEGIVTFKLEEQEGLVKLTLIHEKLPDSKDARVGTLAGWHTHLNILSNQLNDEKSNSFWSTHMSLESEYAAKID